MENWGLITYREKSLLVEEGRTSTSQIQHILSIIVHELAHQVGCIWSRGGGSQKRFYSLPNKKHSSDNLRLKTL